MAQISSSLDGGDGAKEVTFLSWFEQHLSLITSTIDKLKSDLDTIKENIAPHVTKLTEKTWDVYSRFITIALRDVISGAAKDLQNLNSERSEEFWVRFNFPEDWLEWPAWATFITDFEINAFRKENSAKRSRLTLLPNENQNTQVYQEVNDTKTSD